MGNVRSVWNARNLDFQDKSKNVIFKIDGANRKVTVPTGSNFDFSAGTGTITLATGTVAAAAIASNSLSGTQAASVADANVIGGLPLIFRINVADAAGNTDVVTTHKIRIIDAHVIPTGNVAAANTVQVFNGANAITDAMALNTKNAGDIVRAGNIDQTKHEVAAGGTLRVTAVKAGSTVASVVYVTAIRVA